jgi:hypothetical protein|tara:strand:- start:581 stop:1204 length:624 start_codon:yes stop_codon:yes gene_type:complete
MPTTGNSQSSLNRGSEGNNLKKTYTTVKYCNDHGSITFGHIHKEADVISDVMLRGSDGEHFFSMDKDGERNGWTTSMSPGNFQVECGSNRKQDDDTCMINAKNGNIDIIATNGKIRMQANSIELVAVGDNSEGNIVLEATETISLDSSKIIMNSKVKTKIVSSGVTDICSNSCLKLYSSIIRGVSDAVAVKDSKVGGQRFQQECNQA